jgi:hypothetical protein
MNPTGFGPLTLVTFIPLIGALLLLLLPSDNTKLLRFFSLGVSLVAFLGSLYLFAGFVGHTYHFQFVEYVPWIEPLGIHYRMALDGVSIWLYLLTTLLSVISIAFSFYVNHRVKAYMAAMLILETAMLGVFADRPDPLLHVLRSDPHPDVDADQHLGRRAARLCGPQILPVHLCRLHLYAHRHDLAGKPASPSHRNSELQPGRHPIHGVER